MGFAGGRGANSKSLSVEQRRLDHDARLAISREPGHERIAIVKTYIG